MLACAACAAPGVRPVELGLSPIEGGGIEGAPTEGKQADAAPWWRLAGDPVLEKLLDEGWPTIRRWPAMPTGWPRPKRQRVDAIRAAK
jgi:hypothetical protein